MRIETARSNIQLLELSLLLLIGTFASVGSVIRYRWNHGGKGRYERISAELMEKRQEPLEAALMLLYEVLR